MEFNPVILFDGSCNLCTWSVQFIIHHDQECNFKFTSLKSAEGRRIIENHEIPLETVDSFILIDGSQYLTKSSAAIMVLQNLSGWWSILSLITIIPIPIRDWFYDLIALNRFKWFGQANSCPVPSKDVLKRILD